MAYIDKQKTKLIREKLKKEFPRKKGWKFSVRNRDHSCIDIDIMEAPIRFHEKNDVSLNHHNYKNYKNSEILKKIAQIANGYFLPKEQQNFDNSDPMTDYFNVGWYVRINQGKYDKDFKLINL